MTHLNPFSNGPRSVLAVTRRTRYRFGSTSLIALIAAGVLTISGTQVAPTLVALVNLEQETTPALYEDPEKNEASEEDIALADAPPRSVPLVFRTGKTTAPDATQELEASNETVEVSPELDQISPVRSTTEDAMANLAEPLDTSPSPDASAEQEDITIVHAGEQVDDGLDLARLTIAGLGNRRSVGMWVDYGIAVLEIRTPKGMFVAIGRGGSTGAGMQNMNFFREADLDVDPRSDLRVPFLGSRVISLDSMASQLGAKYGVYEINAIALVFTDLAAGQIVRAQNQILDDMVSQGTATTAAELHMTFCFKGADLIVQDINKPSVVTPETGAAVCDV